MKLDRKMPSSYPALPLLASLVEKLVTARQVAAIYLFILKLYLFIVYAVFRLHVRRGHWISL